MRVVLVDDSELFRRGLDMALREQAKEISIAGEARAAREAIEVCRREKPDVVLLDVRLPDRPGCEACREIVAMSSRVRVLMLSSLASVRYVYEAVAAGAHGFLLKEIPPPVLADHIMSAARARPGRFSTFPSTLEIAPPDDSSAARIVSLSAQQRLVLELMAQGLTNVAIARQLGISSTTVKNHVAVVLEKLQIHRRAQAAAMITAFLQPDLAPEARTAAASRLYLPRGA